MIHKKLVRVLLLGAALSSCMMSAGADQTQPQSQRLSPMWGNIEPLWGNIEPLWGNIEPLWGNIEPLWGNIEPLWGNIEPLWGNIEPLWGNIEPLWGNIEPLWGNIEPLWGNIEPLWGNIEPLSGNYQAFWGNIEPLWGNIEPLWGNIEPLWGNIEPLWGNIEPLWGQLQAQNASDYSLLQTDLRTFLANSESDYGAAIEKATGKSFMDGFAAPLLAKYGINVDDPSSLAGVTEQQREAFFLDWYDHLMAYSPYPRVDWWMSAVNWTPEITQTQNLGTHTVIGVLDTKFTDVGTNVKNLQFVGGYDYYVNGHGAAVASLLASQHTPGKVMGIAPNSPVLLYNPFDYTGTAGWEDVAAGINALYAHGATVINASMGVPGSVLTEEWAQIMTSPAVNQTGHNFVLVKAAGNEGVAQTTDVNWIGSAPDNLIIVGSVGPTGQISSFSNTPGNACILVNGACEEKNKLMYHFMVAPGEAILVSDNAGGAMRVSGTSFASPLVAGTVALLQDRWPWLQNHPAETVDILFQTARDLGAPGVDPVYGWGELDVTASQSPIDFNKLTVLAPGVTDYSQAKPIGTMKSALMDPGQLALWNQQGAYIVAFESIGSTFRDFDIPLSSMLVDKKYSDGTEDKPFQSYLYRRLIEWANKPGAFGFNAVTSKVAKGDWNFSLSATEATPEERNRDQTPVHYEFAATNTRTGLGFRFGEGSGAHSLMGMDGFSQRTDFDPATGGVNPVLGFASGGAYGSAEFTYGKAKFSLGFTQKTDDHMTIDPTYGPSPTSPLGANRAHAAVLGVEYAFSQALTVHASFTNLREEDGMFGAQGGGLFAMENGSSTQASTISASYVLPQGWSLFASATTAQSKAPQFAGGALSFNSGNLMSTAYEIAAEKTGVFEKKDTIRLSIAQPLHLEGATLNYQSVQVVDRQTGELGTFSQQWDVSGKRELRMEALYGTQVFDNTGELEGYSLVDINPRTSRTGAPELAIGSRLRFSF